MKTNKNHCYIIALNHFGIPTAALTHAYVFLCTWLTTSGTRPEVLLSSRDRVDRTPLNLNADDEVGNNDIQ